MEGLSIETISMVVLLGAFIGFGWWSNQQSEEWAREYYAYEEAHQHCCKRPYKLPRRNV